MAAVATETRLSRLCDGLIEAGWLVAIVAIPLFFNIHSERVFEPDKLTLLRSIALFMLLVWLVKFVDLGQWREWRRLRWRDANSIWREPLAIPVAAVVLVYIVSSIFSITPRASWLGSYQRLQGTYTTLSYIAIFALMVATLRSFKQVERIVTAVIVTSIPVAFYGLIQHFGLDPLPWGGDVTRRIAGHMGNAIFVAAYLIMVVPLTLSRIVDAFTNILGDEDLSYADVVRSAIYIFVLAIQLLAIYWTGSRGPLIGIAVAVFSFTLVLLVSLRNVTGRSAAFGIRDVVKSAVLVVPALIALLASDLLSGLFSPAIAFGIFFVSAAGSVLAIFVLLAVQRGWKWLWLSWILLTGFLAVWLLTFNIPLSSTTRLQQAPIVGGVFNTLEEWKELPIVGSYGKMLDPTITTGRQKTNRVRVLIWEGVIELIRPHQPLTFPDGREDRFNFWRPLIGYGPESMYVAYNAFYPPELATVEARNASPDRAHNETFDALVITGVLGLLAWQALYLGAIYYGFRYLRVVRSRRDALMLAGAWIVGGIAGAVASAFAGAVYLGVAIPTGTIVGVILYLIYYALVASRYQHGRPY